MEADHTTGHGALIVLILFFFASLFMVAETGCSSDSQDAQGTMTHTSSASETEQWTQDLNKKMDTAIAIMQIIKDDISELEKTEAGSARTTQQAPQQPKTRGEELRSNIDKMVKVLKVIKEDIDEIEKLDSVKEQKDALRKGR